eukprot:6364733-Amphidinium_carterae.1
MDRSSQQATNRKQSFASFVFRYVEDWDVGVGSSPVRMDSGSTPPKQLSSIGEELESATTLMYRQYLLPPLALARSRCARERGSLSAFGALSLTTSNTPNCTYLRCLNTSWTPLRKCAMGRCHFAVGAVVV